MYTQGSMPTHTFPCSASGQRLDLNSCPSPGRGTGASGRMADPRTGAGNRHYGPGAFTAAESKKSSNKQRPQCEKQGWGHCTAEKPGNRAIKINRKNHVTRMYSWPEAVRRAFYLCSSSQKQYPLQSWEKHKTSSNWGTPYETPEQQPSRLSRAWKPAKSEKCRSTMGTEGRG